MRVLQISLNWRKLPIRHKLLFITLSTIVMSLLLVMIGIVAYELTTYRERLKLELNELGRFVAANIAPTLAFNDSETAQEVLNTLNASPEITVAAIYTSDNTLFASYFRSDQPPSSLPPEPGPLRLRTATQYLELVRAVEQKGRRLGTLYFRADMVNVYSRLKGYAGILLVVSLAIAGGAFLLQKLLQRLISEPLLQLSTLAGRIAGGDLSASVPEITEDEIGQLARAFNHMTAELAHSYAELQRNVTQLQSTNKELEAFSYSVSHDLRAPLRHIMGFVELLTKRAGEGLDEKARHYLEIISNSAGTMGNLIDDLLAFSRTGRAEMKQQPVIFDIYIKEIIRDLSSEMEGRDVEWKIQNLPVTFGDPTLLKQVWANLISNAIKFTRPRKHAVIEIGSREEGNDQIFFIKDNGVGFDPKYKDNLFGLFQRLHRPEEFEGTGVGLANVQRTIHRHDGRVWADSTLGEGAEFYFSIPKLNGRVT